MQLFDWLFYQFFLLGRWGKYRTDGRVVSLACRFFGYLLAVNCLFLLLPAFKVSGDAPGVKWLLVSLALIPVAAVVYCYDYRKRYLEVLQRYHDPGVERSNRAMTVRFVLTMVLALSEVMLVGLLMIVWSEKIVSA